MSGIEDIDLSVPDGCPTTMTLTAHPPDFKGSYEYEFALDGATGPWMTIHHGQGPGGQVIASITYRDASNARHCYGIQQSTSSGIQIKVTGKYTVVASGRLICKGSSVWHPFTYRASWTP